MNCVILYNLVSAKDSAGDLDVLQQCVAIEEALHTLGIESRRLACTLDLGRIQDELTRHRPDLVFNLVESLGRTDRMMPAATLLLESLGLPFTGSGSHAILTTTNKIFAKRCLLNQEIPTPGWLSRRDLSWQGIASEIFPESVIVKAVSEHASLGIHDSSVVHGQSVEQLHDLISDREAMLHTAHFAEQYIDGREFNLSVIGSTDGPEVLPPAEIEFVDYANGKPRIVGHNAKWNEDSVESINTPRRFDFSVSDRPLLDELSALARRCWIAFQLRGYARVDFRVDSDGQPWVLEVNANPCLSPNAGFAAALTEAGMSYQDAIRRIVSDAEQ